MNRLPIVFGCLFFSVALPISMATAECTCPEKPSPEVALRQSTTALIGKVVQLSRSAIKSGYFEARFSIMKRLKGFDELKGDTVLVYTPQKPEECGFLFSEGEDYVVFTQGNPAGLRTTSCMGTDYLDSMKKDIDVLMKLAESPSPQ